MTTSLLRNATQLAARLLLAAIFIMAGFSKLGSGYAATQAYMASAGVPGALLPLVILLELGGGLAVLLGWQTRIAAVLLAGFCVLTAVLFHADFGDQTQAILFMKNLAMAGGFLLLAAGEVHAWSLDGLRLGSRDAGRPGAAARPQAG